MTRGDGRGRYTSEEEFESPAKEGFHLHDRVKRWTLTVTLLLGLSDTHPKGQEIEFEVGSFRGPSRLFMNKSLGVAGGGILHVLTKQMTDARFSSDQHL